MIKLLDPHPDALEHARDVSSRINNRPAPVRNGFIERFNADDPDPPLATILRGGQGGMVRLKLLLSLLWFSVRWPHETDYPARAWAALLGLPDPDTNGARRVTAAFTWLEAHGYVRIKPQPGAPSVIYLNDERGTGSEYVLPAAALNAKTEAGEQLTRDDYWVGMPAAFWTKGWAAVLRAPAVAMLLVLMDEAAARRQTSRLWHSPAQAAERFALSQDTRTDGLLELEAYNIVDRKRSSVSPNVFDFKRMRNVYDLHLEQLTVAPGQPRPSKSVTPQDIDKDLAKAPKTSAP